MKLSGLLKWSIVSVGEDDCLQELDAVIIRPPMRRVIWWSSNPERSHKSCRYVVERRERHISAGIRVLGNQIQEVFPKVCLSLLRNGWT